MERQAHEVALDCIETAVGAAAPETATRSAVELAGQTLRIGGSTHDPGRYGGVLVVGEE